MRHYLSRVLTTTICILFLLNSVAFAGLGSHSAMYVGGTVSGASEHAEGHFILGDSSAAFESKALSFKIPYTSVDSLEYGEKAGRRVGLSIAISPLFLLSKKRRHYLTVGYLDDQQKQQAAVLELGKDIIMPTLHTLEAKTGKKVEYQDDEARKAATGK
jgi:hypothetical protein